VERCIFNFAHIGVDANWNTLRALGSEAARFSDQGKQSGFYAELVSSSFNGSAVIGWTSSTAGSYNFTAPPGGAALAGSYSLKGTTTTWVPLLYTDGSTLGLVNAANPDSGPATTHTLRSSGKYNR
jgi:hypothetical protein